MSVRSGACSGCSAVQRGLRVLVGVAAVIAVATGRLAAVADEPLREVHAQPSWILATDDIELAVTRLGGHMAPVTFDRRSERPIRPYHVSPWQEERLADLPAAVLVPLRGDFF